MCSGIERLSVQLTFFSRGFTVVSSEKGTVNSEENIMEEPGEQCTVALTVTEPASECVYAEGRGLFHPLPLPLAASITIHAKTTVHCSIVLRDSSMMNMQGYLNELDVFILQPL